MSPRPRNEDDSDYKKAKRDEVLAAAATLFAERGFAATTVRDIGDMVGMYSGSLYYYFKSKEAMADAMLTRYLDGIWTEYDEIRQADVGAKERLSRILEASIRSIDQYHKEVAVFQREGDLLAQQERFRYIADRIDQFRQLVIELLEEGMATGEFRSTVKPPLTYRFIRDTVWPIVAWYRPGGQLSIDDVCEYYIDTLFIGVAVDESHR